MMSRVVLTFLAAAWLGAGPVAAAETNKLGWLTRPWLSDDGLPNNTVSGLAQTPDNYLWIGTANGLARFDGLRFEEFASSDFIAPPDRGVLALCLGRSGGLRLATDRASIVWLEAGKHRVMTTSDGLPKATVAALFEDREAALWVMYRGGAVARIQGSECKEFGAADGLPEGGMICSMASDSAGKVWFLKNGQLGIVQNGKFQTLARVDAAPGRLVPARGGGVWFCAGFRLYRFKEGGAVESCGDFSEGKGLSEVSVLVESRNGAVWIGTTVNGLFRFEAGQFERVPTTHREILTVMEDAEGTIWVGTGGGGLNQVRPQAVELLTGRAGLPFESVTSLTQDSDGVVWAATQDGSLSRLLDGRWQPVPADDTNWFSDALSVCADPTGGVWIGTRNHRLFRWRDGVFVNWGDVNQIKGQTIHTVVVARNGDVWLGGGDSPAAIIRLRAGKITHYETPEDVRIIRASVEDAAGNIWFGSSKGVLLRVEGDRLVDETERTTGIPQPIRCLSATPDGAVWIGYAGIGVGLLRGKEFTSISASAGLHNDFVSQIIADDHGWMWFAGDRGIFRVRRADLEAVAEGQADRVRSIHHGQGDGLPSLQANFGNTPNSLRSRDGRIWLAMRTGLAAVSPRRLPDESQAPPVLITRVMVGERVVAAYGGVLSPTIAKDPSVIDLSVHRGELRLPPDHRRIEFGFTALSFVGAENVAFRYRLDGSDEDWSDAERRSAPYLRLPKGKYQFRVSACNAQGIWNTTEAIVKFEVEPFLWETWWFRGAVLAGFTGIIIAIVRYVSFRRLRRQLLQLEQQATLHKERARIAKDIHDDLGASLTQISLIGELARQDSASQEKVGGHIEKMSGTARQAVKSLDEIVWAVNPRNDTLAHFIDYTGQFALDYLRLAEVRCRLDLPEQVPPRELSTDVRHNLFLVVKEAINNTVKYAHATELRLRIAVTEEKLELSIEDNGRGFEHPPDAAGADGLRNMEQRLADIGGRCWIQGRPGAGVKISLELPWVRDVKK
jgi:signal transduction histidine kinase/ligand-binding sensor domain-containing protein